MYQLLIIEMMPKLKSEGDIFALYFKPCPFCWSCRGLMVSMLLIIMNLEITHLISQFTPFQTLLNNMLSQFCGSYGTSLRVDIQLHTCLWGYYYCSY